ncbi:uncharacterized protein [Diabrotica undecimpunctata]|uniref:uncharacterized protein n=1 Tax=Diabrotica undecimpunctata TaxID=50387 RepID=UPI003B63FCDF
MKKKAQEIKSRKGDVVKRKIVNDLSDGRRIVNKDRHQTERKGKRNIGTRPILNNISSDEEEPFSINDDEQEDCACIYCNDTFSRSKSNEGWLRCQICQNWSHSECAGLPKKAKQFICEVCMN